MAVEFLTRKSDGWYKGCGCGQKKGDLVTPPVESVELIVAFNGSLEGPSQQRYTFVSTGIAIDVKPEDAAAFKEQKIARDVTPGLKGYLSRAV